MESNECKLVRPKGVVSKISYSRSWKIKMEIKKLRIKWFSNRDDSATSVLDLEKLFKFLSQIIDDFVETLFNDTVLR